MNNGPVEDRSCTDVICCLVFLAFLVGLVGVSGYGLVYGDPMLFLTMWDADGNGCGASGNATEEYPYLYWPIIDLDKAKNDKGQIDVKELLKFGTCVKECPLATGKVDCYRNDYMVDNINFVEDCVYSVVANPAEYAEKYDIDLSEYGDFEGVTSVIRIFDVRYETEVIGGKVCFPVIPEGAQKGGMAVVKKFYDEAISKLDESGVTDYINDTLATWQVLCIGLATSFLVGFIYLVLLRYIVGPIVYGSIILTFVVIGASGYMLY